MSEPVKKRARINGPMRVEYGHHVEQSLQITFPAVELFVQRISRQTLGMVDVKPGAITAEAWVKGIQYYCIVWNGEKAYSQSWEMNNGSLDAWVLAFNDTFNALPARVRFYRPSHLKLQKLFTGTTLAGINYKHVGPEAWKIMKILAASEGHPLSVALPDDTDSISLKVLNANCLHDGVVPPDTSKFQCECEDCGDSLDCKCNLRQLGFSETLA